MRINDLLPAAALVAALACPALAAADPIDDAVAGNHRDPANVARDPYRHPAETLRFFGLRPDMTVVEVWPGGGWYTEIIAPVVAKEGRLYAAQFIVEGDVPGYRPALHRQLLGKKEAHPDLYATLEVTWLGPGQTAIAPPGSADLVLTFRNVHNWIEDGFAAEAFRAFYTALKPGGVLGVVEHRAKPGTPPEKTKGSGYLTEDEVIALAREAGFELVERSELNANPKDTRDHEMGVWTLPPSLRACRDLAGEAKQSCEEKYRAIGESDRMTLKFRKPAG